MSLDEFYFLIVSFGSFLGGKKLNDEKIFDEIQWRIVRKI